MAEGGQKLKVTTVFNRIPLYVRAGSIVPLGPDVQYVTEKKWDNLKVCVYPGADGNFVLYEDEGNNYNYENGAYTEIPMIWNDAKRTLTIDARRGCYEGMLDERKFTVRMPDGSEKTVLYKREKRLSGNFWLLSFKISYLCLPLFYETRTTPSCHPSGCAYRQL